MQKFCVVRTCRQDQLKPYLNLGSLNSQPSHSAGDSTITPDPLHDFGAGNVYSIRQCHSTRHISEGVASEGQKPNHISKTFDNEKSSPGAYLRCDFKEASVQQVE